MVRAQPRRPSAEGGARHLAGSGDGLILRTSPSRLRSSLPTSRLAEHHGFLGSISAVQVRILQIRNPKQIQKAENPKSQTSIPESLGDSSAFSCFRIWDLFRISSFGFRISEPDRRCPAPSSVSKAQRLREAFQSRKTR